jgi:hypothetical protein
MGEKTHQARSKLMFPARLVSHTHASLISDQFERLCAQPWPEAFEFAPFHGFAGFFRSGCDAIQTKQRATQRGDRVKAAG